MNLNTKRYTLILNKSFQALSVEGVKKTLGYFVGDEGYALDPVSYELFTFEQWVEKQEVIDVNNTLKSEKFWILIPEILVLKTSNQKKYVKTRSISKRKVFDRDGNRCGYCGRSLNSSNRTIDHVIPTSKGGKNVYENVTACCGECNSAKGDKLLSELNWKLEHELYSPQASLVYHVPKNKILASWEPYL